ncbi:putative aspartyl protease [Ophiocordyceps polyrhachis-furcata BCC 54312]|uniref:Aspartyl protease n=1 Tax=Ophiocordyceps polyrhachis-furcata BCC 54312 TaxID=1330021 RepID=A0A367LRB8_9HYPO|nr:putative aspartyl protease [Ophiocordyceps polyrhachis-furcata BCC 54312]
MLSALWPLSALPLAAGLSSPSDNRMLQQDGLLRFPITAVETGDQRLRRRQNDVALAPQKNGFFYSIEVKLGTPPQAVSVNFDTGSDEFWVNPVCGKSSDAAFCSSFGRFNGSQTFVDVHRNGTVNYGTGFAKVEYGYDFMQLGSARVSQQLVGVATDSEFAVTGILGAGPSLDGWKSPFPTIIDNLATQGFTKSRAFSLDIRSLESHRGSVVFGGIDVQKFRGKLEKRPIIPAAQSPDGLTRYWVYLDGLSMNLPNGSKVAVLDKDNGQAVLLDSGYTVSTLPDAIFSKILAAFPTAQPPAAGDNLYRVPCDLSAARGSLDFRFGKTRIRVLYSDFIWRQATGKSCVLGAARDDNFPVLGDTFLRAAYVVYDWDNRNIHLAPSHDCGSRLVPIGSGPDAVPSVAGECGPGPAATTTPPRLNSTTTTMGANNSTAVGRPSFNSTSGSLSGPSGNNNNNDDGGGGAAAAAQDASGCSGDCSGRVPWVVTSTRTHADCRGSGPCSPSTQVFASTAFLLPESTGIWTVPRTHTCVRAEDGCVPGQKVTSTFTVTVRPATTAPAPTPVPGCDDCRMPPPAPRAVSITAPPESQPSASSSPARVPSPPSQPVSEPSGSVTAGASSSPCISFAVVAVVVLAFVGI